MVVGCRALIGVLVLCVALGACQEDVVAPPATNWDAWPWMTTSIALGSISVTGSITAHPTTARTLRVHARFTNTGADSVRVEHGACSFGIRVRPSNGSAQMPIAWDNRPASSVCILPLYWFYVPANGMREVIVGDVAPSALRGVVPLGQYDVYATWRVAANGSVFESRAGALSVTAP